MTTPEPGDAVLRGALVEALRLKGCLRSPALAEAFGAVPRHLFIPHVAVEEAYRDRHIVTKRLPDGEAISSCSQPYIMAVMLDQLDVRPGHRVLEIGAGTGYNAALLAHLVGAAGRVTTIDIDADTAAAARAHLDSAGVIGVRVICGDQVALGELQAEAGGSLEGPRPGATHLLLTEHRTPAQDCPRRRGEEPRWHLTSPWSC